MSSHQSDFGALAPSPFQNWWRARAAAMPTNWVGRTASMIFRRIAGVRSGRPFDVDVFTTEKARLHPYDNICEKRVYATPQFWDLAERTYLAETISASESETFHFADIGANVGLYSLFVRSAARASGQAVRIVAVEPADEVRNRFAYNINASEAGDVIEILPWAVTPEPGPVELSVNSWNRGQTKVKDTKTAKTISVSGKTLLHVFDEAGFERVDAMKIDIEGAEKPVLDAFFDQADRARWPKVIVLETIFDWVGPSALASCVERGYTITLQTKMNAVLVLAD